VADDTLLPIGQREEAILEMVGPLDRAAQAVTGTEQKEAQWTKAIELLDAFNVQNPGHPRTREFQLQAGVYRWAQGQSGRDLCDLNPTDLRARQRVVAALDDAITRLRAVQIQDADKVLVDNLRFRLARALADRASLEPSESVARRAQELEALELLKTPPSEPGLKGFVGLLKADLLQRDGKFDEASSEIDAAMRSNPPPSEQEVLGVRIPVLARQKKHEEAEALIKGSHLSDAAKDLEMLRLRLSELETREGGAKRFSDEQEVFRLMDSMRQRKSNETRLAMATLSRSGLEPDPRHEPQVWDTLAEASEVLGDAGRAAALEERAARRAGEMGHPEAAAGFRLRGGGFLFRAGRYREADELLTRVADDPKAGSARAKAGMLRTLARGRALAAGMPGMTPAAYADALERQVRDFPKDPATDEARWLLGTLARTNGEPARAEALWREIDPGSPRWLDAALARAELERIALESLLPTGDRPLLSQGYERALSHLADCLRRSRNEAELAELRLEEARLNLVPSVGKPSRALATLNALGKTTLSPKSRYRVRLYRMISLTLVGPPYLESEREAQTHTSWADPSARSAFFDAIRLIDECASHSEVDLRQRRLGLILRLLVQPATMDGDPERWTLEENAELKLRLTRAFLFLGDAARAQASLRGWTSLTKSAGDELLRDLADTYSRLEAYELALDVQRLRSKELPAGSVAWFDARYGLALAYFHSGQLKQAAQLIDATAILHPDLGGGTIEKKFIRLRQRLGERP
jgi:tetratricopeptide (TPR) repeat protein